MASHDPQIVEIMALLAKVSERFEPEDGEMKRWMMERFDNPQLADMLHDMTITMIKVLDAIGRLEPVNGITISKQSGVPKGSVSKIVRRLTAKRLITEEHLPNNKKEILFRLTPLGREVFEAHRAFDAQMERGFIQFLEHYDTDELAFIVRLLEDLAVTSFLHPEQAASITRNK